MADDDKTEEPTDKKVSDAREEGNVAKSAEISGVTVNIWNSIFTFLFILFFS